MDTEVAIIRILHIVPGAVWVGSAVFVAFILNPRLRDLGPEVERPVTVAVNRVMGPIVTGAAVITILVGFVLMSRTPGRGWSELFDTGWGWAIGIGIVVAIAALSVGGMTGMSQARVRRLSDGIDEGSKIASLEARIRIYERSHALLAVVATSAMASARFV